MRLIGLDPDTIAAPDGEVNIVVTDPRTSS
jgi:hypothetical protein